MPKIGFTALTVSMVLKEQLQEKAENLVYKTVPALLAVSWQILIKIRVLPQNNGFQPYINNLEKGSIIETEVISKKWGRGDLNSRPKRPRLRA